MHEVVCVSISADLHVHLQILSLIFVSFISINALWLISCLPMVFITFSICTKDAPLKLLTYISDQNIQIYIYIKLEGLMLKLKLQYFGHLMQRADSFEKTLVLGKIEYRRRRG